jgi:hypothetical protein
VIAGVLDALEPGLGADLNFVAAVLDQAKAIQTPT